MSEICFVNVGDNIVETAGRADGPSAGYLTGYVDS